MINNLTYDVLNEIGLEIDSFHRLIDQDFRNLLTFKNKILKETLHEDEELIINPYNEVALDIIRSKDQMRYLFGYYLNKKNDLEGIYFPTFYTVENKHNGKSYVEAKDQNGTVYRSNEYRNENLRYIDLILKIEETPKDLSALDIKY